MTKLTGPSLGQWIRDSRKTIRWTQAELGRHFEISQAKVSQWENGRSEPDEEELRRLQRLFGASAEQVGGTPEEVPPNSEPSTVKSEPSVRRKTSRQQKPPATSGESFITEDAPKYDAGRPQHAELMRQLWEAAVNLRGSIEPRRL